MITTEGFCWACQAPITASDDDPTLLACPECAEHFPPLLLRAIAETENRPERGHNHFTVQVHTGDIIAFTMAMPYLAPRYQWVCLFSDDRSVDVRLDAIVWCAVAEPATS